MPTRSMQTDWPRNPLHQKWRSSWIVGQPFDLLTLLSPSIARTLDTILNGRRLKGQPFTAMSSTSFVPSPTATCLPTKQWATSMRGDNRLLEEAHTLNIFALPLSESDLRSTVKSIADWTWRRFSKKRFSDIQRDRARCGRALVAQSTAALIENAINALGNEGPLSLRGASPRVTSLYIPEDRSAPCAAMLLFPVTST